MKKALLLLPILLLTACSTSESTPEEQLRHVAHNPHVQTEVSKLQQQLDRGEITEQYAQEKLKQILKNRVEANSGSPESILKKIEAIDPQIAEGLRQQIEAQQNAEN
ncbi:MAG: hypothetical protein K9M51_02395 [Candidatus Gracilibacteria bacterium]|nr:hypothetical protein [Candidatus Gracilibacteria bacterium]